MRKAIALKIHIGQMTFDDVRKINNKFYVGNVQANGIFTTFAEIKGLSTIPFDKLRKKP